MGLSGKQLLAICQGLPKVDLHLHLDGSVRPSTVLELAGIMEPSKRIAQDEIERKMRASIGCESLTQYLAFSAFATHYLQDPTTLERVAFELVEDSARENVVYTEVRFCPALHTAKGASINGLVEGVLAGLRRGEEATGLPSRLILCALREHEAASSQEIAKAAADYRDRGVVALDLAGLETGASAEKHYPAFEIAGEAGVHRIAHAGEGAGPESIREAVRKLGAERLGHATRLMGDPALLEEVAERKIPVEVCLTSNVHTRAIADLSEHPFVRYVHSGIPVTINTDNRTVSQTTMSSELARAWAHGGLTSQEIRQIVLTGVESAFLPEEEKVALRGKVQRGFTEVLAHVT